MTNWHVEERLTAYLADETPDDEKVFIESHLEVCPQCQAELELLRDLETILDDLPLEQPSADFTDNVMLNIASGEIGSNSQSSETIRRFWKGSDFRNMAASMVAAFVLFQGVSGIMPDLPKYDSAITGYTVVAKVKVDLWVAEIFHSWDQ
jgi:anti-sigma factor RsiW